MQFRLNMSCAALLATMLLPGAAGAASLYPQAGEQMGPISWTGFVIAPYFGYETTYLKGNGSPGLDDPSGWRIGAELDYDYQIGDFVVGIAGDGFFTWYDSNGIGLKSTVTTRLYDYETVRLRLGYTMGRWMIYGTGGAAFGDMQISDSATGLSDRKTLTGWTAGGGAEWMWSDNFALRGEVAHIDFGTATFGSLPAPNNEVGATLDLFKIDFVSRF